MQQPSEVNDELSLHLSVSLSLEYTETLIALETAATISQETFSQEAVLLWSDKSNARSQK